VLTFLDETTEEGAERLERALRALVVGVARLGIKRLSIETIDAERARSSDLAEAFTRAGFRAGYRGFEMERPLGGGSVVVEDDALGSHENGGRDRGDG